MRSSGTNPAAATSAKSIFAIRRLILFAEVAAAGFVPLERIQAHQLAQLEEIRHPPGLLERLVQFLARAEHAHFAPELLAQLGNPAQGVFQALRGAAHSAVVPHKLAQLAVERIDRARSLD